MSGLYADILHNYVHGPSLRPQAVTAGTNGSAVDLDNTLDGFAELVVGAVSGTSPTLDVKLQESETSGGTYTDIAGATFAQVVAANKEEVLNFKRSKRHVRAAVTTGGTSPSFTLAVSIFGRKRVAP